MKQSNFWELPGGIIFAAVKTLCVYFGVARKAQKWNCYRRPPFTERKREQKQSPGSSNFITQNSTSLSNSSVVSRIGSVLESVIDTFRSPKPRSIPVDGSSSKATSSHTDTKEVEQPRITVSSNGRVRTPSLKTIKLTPELVT